MWSQPGICLESQARGSQFFSEGSGEGLCRFCAIFEDPK